MISGAIPVRQRTVYSIIEHSSDKEMNIEEADFVTKGTNNKEPNILENDLLDKKADNEKTKNPGWGEFKEEEGEIIQKSKVTKQYEYARNGARVNIKQRLEIMDSQMGTEKFIIYSQEKANEEGSDKPINNKMTKARN